jgi:transcriptional regulator with XRE-family HTH domain
MTRTEVANIVRRVRRTADMSQRELAVAANVAKSTIAAIEANLQSPRVETLEAILRVGGCMLVAINVATDQVEEVWPWNSFGLRDRSGRLFPAHLDIREVGPGGEGWWGTERLLYHGRTRPRHTFDRDRRCRDDKRRQGDVVD